jgi:hypothetical protein
LGSTEGQSNTAVGNEALFSMTGGSFNTALGAFALDDSATGSNNIAIGYLSGRNAQAPSNSIFIGSMGATNDTNTIRIGAQGLQSAAFMGGIKGANTGAGAVSVLIDSTGRLGTDSSSRRYKEDIQPLGDVSAALLKLRPVTFRYKKPDADGTKSIRYGLIAEEVAEVLPDLAVFNEDGQPETVKYHLLPSFLLAAYQRQQQTIAAQAERAEQQREIIQAQRDEMAAVQQRLRRLEALLARDGGARLPRAAASIGATP